MKSHFARPNIIGPIMSGPTFWSPVPLLLTLLLAILTTKSSGSLGSSLLPASSSSLHILFRARVAELLILAMVTG